MLCWTCSKMLCSIISASTLGYKCFALGWLNIPHRLSVTSVAAAAANFNVMFVLWLLWLKLSATHILLPQQLNLNVIERKFRRQILMPDPIILGFRSLSLNIYCCCGVVNTWHLVPAMLMIIRRYSDPSNSTCIHYNYAERKCKGGSGLQWRCLRLQVIYNIFDDINQLSSKTS